MSIVYPSVLADSLYSIYYSLWCSLRPALCCGFIHDVEHIVQDGWAQVQLKGEERPGDLGQGIL